MYRVIIEEVWPKAEREAIVVQGNTVHPSFNPLWIFAARLRDFDLSPWTTCCFQALCRAQEQGDCLRAGTLAGMLFVGLIWRTPAQRDWYWAKALELLDRLCEIGADQWSSDLGSPAAEDVLPILLG
jgi:hypothetical protein